MEKKVYLSRIKPINVECSYFDNNGQFVMSINVPIDYIPTVMDYEALDIYWTDGLAKFVDYLKAKYPEAYAHWKPLKDED